MFNFIFHEKKFSFLNFLILILTIILIFILYGCAKDIDVNTSNEISITETDIIETAKETEINTEPEYTNIQTEDITETTEYVETTENNEKDILISFDEMKSVIESYGNNISVFYKDCVSGEIYNYNPESEYYIIASVIKAPYAMYIYKLASENKCDLNEKIEYTPEAARLPVSIVGNSKFGELFTIEQLLEYSIRESDNTAYQMLVNRFGYTGFKNYFENRGYETKNMPVDMNDMTNIEWLSIYLEEIYNFIDEKSEYSEKLKENMLNTNMQLIKATEPVQVARKYGAITIYLHEIGIIFNKDRPYLLIIMANGYYNATDITYAIIKSTGELENYHESFMKISLAVEKYNNSKIN